jgi:hypothetical protein
MGMPTTMTIVGLNPQQPVSTQTIIDTFVGLIIGMGIATIVGRLIWPVFPQMVMRANLLALFGDIKAVLDGDPHREKVQTQLAILPVEALHASRQIRSAGCSEQEKAKAWRVGSSAANSGYPGNGAGFSQTYRSGNHKNYPATGEALEECRRLIGTLKINRYWGHCGL